MCFPCSEAVQRGDPGRHGHLAGGEVRPVARPWARLRMLIKSGPTVLGRIPANVATPRALEDVMRSRKDSKGTRGPAPLGGQRTEFMRLISIGASNSEACHRVGGRDDPIDVKRQRCDGSAHHGTVAHPTAEHWLPATVISSLLGRL